MNYFDDCCGGFMVVGGVRDHNLFNQPLVVLQNLPKFFRDPLHTEISPPQEIPYYFFSKLIIHVVRAV